MVAPAFLEWMGRGLSGIQQDPAPAQHTSCFSAPGPLLAHAHGWPSFYGACLGHPGSECAPRPPCAGAAWGRCSRGLGWGRGLIPACDHQLSERYGPVFTLHLGRQKTVVLAGYEAVREALVGTGPELADRPPIAIFQLIQGGGGRCAAQGGEGAAERTSPRTPGGVCLSEQHESVPGVAPGGGTQCPHGRGP